MKKRYQIDREQAVRRFHKQAEKSEQELQLHLPLKQVAAALQDGVGQLMRQAGLELMQLIMDNEVRQLAGEHYLRYYARIHGVGYVALRYSNVYGPRQDPHGEGGVVAIFALAMLAGKPITIFGDGNDERDYVYVSDVVDAVIAAAAPGGPHRCNIGSGAGTNVNELCTRLSKLTGYALEPQYGPPRPGDIHAISLDATLARTDLGWTPKVDLETGLTRTVEFFRKQAAG